MNKKYTKKQIQEAIKYWTKRLNEDDSSSAFHYSKGTYLYITQLNDSFTTPVRKIGSSHGSLQYGEDPETFAKKIKRYNTTVVNDWMPAYLIELSDEDARKVFTCEKELFNMLNQSRIGNKELFTANDAEVQQALESFVQMHPTAKVYSF
jgi:hypothetical protein